jgi:hypothetical protein
MKYFLSRKDFPDKKSLHNKSWQLENEIKALPLQTARATMISPIIAHPPETRNYSASV